MMLLTFAGKRLPLRVACGIQSRDEEGADCSCPNEAVGFAEVFGSGYPVPVCGYHASRIQYNGRPSHARTFSKDPAVASNLEGALGLLGQAQTAAPDGSQLWKDLGDLYEQVDDVLENLGADYNADGSSSL